MAGFDFTIPSEEEVKAEIIQITAPSTKEKEEVVNVAQLQAEKVMMANLDSFEERKAYTDTIEQFGMAEVKTSDQNNQFLNKCLANYSVSDKDGETSETSGEIARTLADLTIKMRDLDPAGIDFTKPSGLFKRMARPVQKYFEKYNKANVQIAEILKSLQNGKTTLINDNTTLEREQASLRETTKKLAKDIEMGLALAEQLKAAVEKAKADGADEERVKFVEEELIFPLNQRIEDFQQLLAVDQQGVIAMEIIRRNNKELIRSVDRACNISVNAMQTAVTVAGALYNQKIVLDQVNAVNTATNNMIASTSRMLREQGVATQKQAVEGGISAEVLQESFENTLQALDDLSNYRRDALTQMDANIKRYKALADKGEEAIAKMEGGNAMVTQG